MFDTFQVQLKGTVGKNFLGDIAVDDLWFDEGECPQPGMNFEYLSFLCLLKLNSSFKWKLKSIFKVKEPNVFACFFDNWWMKAAFNFQQD